MPWADNTCTHPRGSTYLPKQNTVLETAENYIGYLNEPYGSGQADYTPTNAVLKWPDFWKWVEELAEKKGVSTDEIQIIGPSISSHEKVK